jgi:hypothetical protein
MHVEQRVGRLAEVRYVDPLTMDELTKFMAGVRDLVQRAPEPLVFCCDWRHVGTFDQTVADTIVWIMRRDNPKIAKNGVLVSTRQLFGQVERILSDAGNPRRKVFLERTELCSWLDTLLVPEERKRRDAFLDET